MLKVIQSMVELAVGVAGIINGISNIHESFLNAGCLGILVGDGQIPHSGPTLDYQFINNFAYTPTTRIVAPCLF